MKKNNNKKDKLSITVVIPSLNEEQNIANVLKDILVQKNQYYLIKKILVVSDGSTDNTVEVAKSLNNDLIDVKDYKKRLGKPERLNQVMKAVETDVLVQIDADIRLSDKRIIDKLIEPIVEKDAQLVFGDHEPVKPTTLIERLSYFGFKVWLRAKTISKSDRYWSSGQVRAFSRKFAKSFNFPEEIGSMEDVYSFYYAKFSGNKVVVQKDARISFRLPATFNDYVNQMRRFLQTPNRIRDYFDEDLLNRYERIDNKIRLKAYLKEGIRNPFVAVPYLLLQTYTRYKAKGFKQPVKWDPVTSSKKINLES